jgi:hypothetical protein
MAQDAFGKFTLAREVRWGSVLLAPGEYSYSVEHHSAETILLRSQTGRTSAILMAASVSTLDGPTTSQLVLENNGKEWFVRSLALGGRGEVLYFNPPSTRAETAQVAHLGHEKTSAVSHP